MAYQDEEGFIFIVDRKKDRINRGGENIYPREVKIAIEAHPKVREVSVIGVPDPAPDDHGQGAQEGTAPHGSGEEGLAAGKGMGFPP